jgi:hypothetical protein
VPAAEARPDRGGREPAAMGAGERLGGAELLAAAALAAGDERLDRGALEPLVLAGVDAGLEGGALLGAAPPEASGRAEGGALVAASRSDAGAGLAAFRTREPGGLLQRGSALDRGALLVGAGALEPDEGPGTASRVAGRTPLVPAGAGPSSPGAPVAGAPEPDPSGAREDGATPGTKRTRHSGLQK